jgi:hypothetical protein
MLAAPAVLVAWTMLALLFAVTSSLTYMSTGRPPRWALTVSMALADCWVWAALTFPVLALARRLPLERGTLFRNVPLHFLAAVVTSILKVAIDRWVRRSIFGFPVSYFLISNLAPHFVIYWAVVGSAHGMAYYRRSRERELLASHLEARLAETRLQLLQMQLQPHFLFNTLHAISELVHEDPETADRMIGGLSDLLREALDASGVREVPLERELQLLHRYIDIQTARFGDRLKVVVEADPRALGARLPSLILQPIVENAIRHGLASRAAPGRIDVRATTTDDRLIVEVADDGAGLEDSSEVREGVGLGNTRARLHELYGSHGTLEVRSRQARGVSVIIAVPLRRAETS